MLSAPRPLLQLCVIYEAVFATVDARGSSGVTCVHEPGSDDSVLAAGAFRWRDVPFSMCLWVFGLIV